MTDAESSQQTPEFGPWSGWNALLMRLMARAAIVAGFWIVVLVLLVQVMTHV